MPRRGQGASGAGDKSGERGSGGSRLAAASAGDCGRRPTAAPLRGCFMRRRRQLCPPPLQLGKSSDRKPLEARSWLGIREEASGRGGGGDRTDSRTKRAPMAESPWLCVCVCPPKNNTWYKRWRHMIYDGVFVYQAKKGFVRTQDLVGSFPNDPAK